MRQIARAAVAFALTAATASAEQTPAATPSPSPQPPRYEDSVQVEARETLVTSVSTATKLAVPAESLPVSVAAVSEAVIETQDARVVGDALKNVAGVNVGSNFGIFDFFTIRGFDSLTSSLVLTDGAFEPESTYYHLYNVRRVEVLKGPAAYLYGANPLSGTVNLVRKQPVQGRFGELRLSGGSFSTFLGQFDGNYASSDSKVAFRFNGMAQSSDNYRDDKKSEVFAVNPAVTFQLGARTPLTLNLEYVDSTYKPDVGLPVIGGQVPDVPRTRSYQSPFDTSEQGVLRLRADFSTPLGANGVLRNKLYYTDLDWKSDGTLLSGAFPGFPGDFVIVRVMSQLDDRQKMLGNQLEASWNVGTGSVRHNLLVGLEASRLSDDFTLDVALLPVISLGNPIETATRPLFNIPGQSLAGDARTQVLAPYAVDQIALTDKLQVLAGARFDSLDYEDKATATDRHSNQLSPMLGVSFAPVEKLSLYANFGKAFGPPSSLVVGPREPEKSRQYEAGAKAKLFGGKAHVSAAGFQIERENVAIPDSSGITRQQGSQKSKGIEAELQAEVRSDWFAFASYAWTDAKLTEFREVVVYSQQPPVFAVLDHSGNHVPFAPRNLFNFWTQREWKNGFGAAAGARYVCTQFIAEDNEAKIPDYWLFDAELSYKVKQLRFQLNLKNLGDQKYSTRGFGNTALLPANPFAVYAGVQLGLGARP